MQLTTVREKCSVCCFKILMEHRVSAVHRVFLRSAECTDPKLWIKTSRYIHLNRKNKETWILNSSPILCAWLYSLLMIAVYSNAGISTKKSWFVKPIPTISALKVDYHILATIQWKKKEWHCYQIDRINSWLIHWSIMANSNSKQTKNL